MGTGDDLTDVVEVAVNGDDIVEVVSGAGGVTVNDLSEFLTGEASVMKVTAATGDGLSDVVAVTGSGGDLEVFAGANGVVVNGVVVTDDVGELVTGPGVDTEEVYSNTHLENKWIFIMCILFTLFFFMFLISTMFCIKHCVDRCEITKKNTTVVPA